jgi:hypothetical protein
MVRYRYNKAKACEALTAAQGNVSAAARGLGCCRQILARHIKADPDLAAIVESYRDTLLDIAESVIMREVAAGNLRAAEFALAAPARC